MSVTVKCNTNTVVLHRIYFTRLNFYEKGIFFASFFVALIVQIIQKRITRMVFIKGRTRFIIQNRAPLLHYWYFMVFTSMTRALTSYIIRTLKLVLRYPFFSLRVDRNAETWSVRRGDGGMLYMILCLLDLYINLTLLNGLRLRVFCILWDGKYT